MNKKEIIKYLSLIAVVSLLVLPSCDRYNVGIKKNKGLLTKTLFYKGIFPGGIRTIQIGLFNDNRRKEIFILSQKNCHIFDLKTRKLIRSIEYGDLNDLRPEILNIKNDGSLEIMLRGGGFGDVGIVNQKGEFTWMWPRESGDSPSMTVADLDKDGKLEFYVADKYGLYKLDHLGKRLWDVKSNFWESEVQIYDPNGRGAPLILTKGNNGKIFFRNKMGITVKEVNPEKVTYGLEIIKWPESYRILARTDYEIILLDLDGKTFFKYKLTEDICKYFFHLLEIMAIRGVPVMFDSNQEPYLAILTKHRAALKKSMLSIFSYNGQLIYQEMLNATTGINLINNEDGTQSLIVGEGTENIWIYNLKGGERG